MNDKITENEKGYLVFKDSGNLVHRWVASKKYPGEVIANKEVHHVDGRKKNNDKSNLILVSREDHYLIHIRERFNRALYSLIIGLSLFYLITVSLVNYTSLLNKEVAMAFARTAVYAILVVAVELKYSIIRQCIRSPFKKLEL